MQSAIGSEPSPVEKLVSEHDRETVVPVRHPEDLEEQALGWRLKTIQDPVYCGRIVLLVGSKQSPSIEEATSPEGLNQVRLVHGDVVSLMAPTAPSFTVHVICSVAEAEDRNMGEHQKPFLLVGNILDTTEVHAEMLQELTTPDETVQQFRKEITDTENILSKLQMQSRKRSASWLADESPQKKWRQLNDFAMEL